MTEDLCTSWDDEWCQAYRRMAGQLKWAMPHVALVVGRTSPWKKRTYLVDWRQLKSDRLMTWPSTRESRLPTLIQDFKAWELGGSKSKSFRYGAGWSIGYATSGLSTQMILYDYTASSSSIEVGCTLDDPPPLLQSTDDRRLRGDRWQSSGVLIDERTR